MLWADNRSIAMQILFPEQAFSIHISSHFYFSNFTFPREMFRYFLLSLPVLVSVEQLQLELKCRETSFLNS